MPTIEKRLESIESTLGNLKNRIPEKFGTGPIFMFFLPCDKKKYDELNEFLDSHPGVDRENLRFIICCGPDGPDVEPKKFGMGEGE